MLIYIVDGAANSIYNLTIIDRSWLMDCFTLNLSLDS